MFGWWPSGVALLQWDFSFGISDLAVVALALITWRIQRRQTEIMDFHKRLARDVEDDRLYHVSVDIIRHIGKMARCIIDLKARGEVEESEVFIARNWPLYAHCFNDHSKSVIRTIINAYFEYLPAKIHVENGQDVEANNVILRNNARNVARLYRRAMKMKPYIPHRMR